MEESARICPWCSAPIPAEVHVCPRCGAAVEGSVGTEIPGLTTVDPKPMRGAAPEAVPNPLEWLTAGREPVGNEEAFRPPSEAVRLEMRKMELEAQILNAGTEVMNPTGDVTIEVGAPSQEAVAAFEAGLLDASGPAGEEIAEIAEPWEHQGPNTLKGG